MYVELRSSDFHQHMSCGFGSGFGSFLTGDGLSCRQATNANPLDKILHGSVGYLTPRSGGIFD